MVDAFKGVCVVKVAWLPEVYEVLDEAFCPDQPAWEVFWLLVWTAAVQMSSE